MLKSKWKITHNKENTRGMDISYIYMRIYDHLTTHAYGNLSSGNRLIWEELETWVTSHAYRYLGSKEKLSMNVLDKTEYECIG